MNSITLCKKEVIITASYDNITRCFIFDYCNPKGESCSSLEIEEPSKIVYKLVDNTGCGLKFAGVAFSNPFNKVITKSIISPDKESITLIDPFDLRSESENIVSFEFMFSHTHSLDGEEYNHLLLISSDPEVSNKGENCPPPSH
ncbi:DP-EP family protein [Gallaecimonas pentaromativorans]|uniref:Uncharacterized protein DUF1888 n=1 Tax=Gallaecimonas pentaromativorans TaxID=584787 RepID=A0A3N1Q172_9GAMM|nr:DP-EP family protein [Gallaecimonas pentaromativorans]ROQ30576.1 uncharacterized protein DUF1888 [Gallaecimonas pentaromativorans]